MQRQPLRYTSRQSGSLTRSRRSIMSFSCNMSMRDINTENIRVI
nr:MAG TPA_asm: hypothetical protein [Caudoviricetes sp.]